jgi:hypothetical protein
MILNNSMILLGQRGVDEMINSSELTEVCVTNWYDFGRPYTTDPLFHQNKLEYYILSRIECYT